MKALRELRKGKGWTQQQLARALSISPSTIGMYEQGRREPDNATLLKIAALFNVSTDYLLGKQNDTQPAIISTQSTDTTLPLSQATLKPETLETAQKLEALNNDAQRMITDMINREYERSSAFVLEEEGIA